jgi:hypothetical protein
MPETYPSMLQVNEPVPMLTRKRYLELVNIAKETCEFLEKKGVTVPEGCQLRVIVEKLWSLEKEVKK